MPCVPGYHGPIQDDDGLIAQAQDVGYPVMVKAAAGGGGRGMRLVHRPQDMNEALESARSEARSAFGDDQLLLERAVQGARHVEVQVLADTHGHTVHLFERDCSTQRRHQKVIEEAPSPALTPELRAHMGQAAVAAARAVGYVGAGTVEFLVDANGRDFFFLEMNTRLQVEHPVTEMITGLDLVALQLQIAQGEPLPFSQDDLTMTGHAVEARLYAEDPSRGFLPQTGRLDVWRPPPFARTDSGVAEGQQITPHYDPMIAKVITHGRTRHEAIALMRRALERTIALGTTTNRDFLLATLDHARFVEGQATTTFVQDELLDDQGAWSGARRDPHLGAALYHLSRQRAGARDAWSSAGARASMYRLSLDDEDAVRVWIDQRDRVLDMTLEGDDEPVTLSAWPVAGDPHSWRVEREGRHPHRLRSPERT